MVQFNGYLLFVYLAKAIWWVATFLASLIWTYPAFPFKWLGNFLWTYALSAIWYYTSVGVLAVNSYCYISYTIWLAYYYLLSCPYYYATLVVGLLA